MQIINISEVTGLLAWAQNHVAVGSFAHFLNNISNKYFVLSHLRWCEQ